MNSIQNNKKQILYSIFMNSKNSNSFDPHSLVFYLADKINLKKTGKYAALSNFSICYTWKNMKKSYKNNKSKISAPTQNEEFEFRDGSYFVSNIQDYFKYILKNHEAATGNPSIMIYIYNKY